MTLDVRAAASAQMAAVRAADDAKVALARAVSAHHANATHETWPAMVDATNEWRSAVAAAREADRVYRAACGDVLAAVDAPPAEQAGLFDVPPPANRKPGSSSVP